MHPQIATIANQVFYQGMLLNDESTEQLIYRHQSPLFDANSVTLIDTTTILNDHDYKAIPRFNRYNSTLSLQILNNLLEQGLTEKLTIGYTSPFKRQTQLVRRKWKELLTEQCQEAKRDKQKLTIDTIHSFQGNQVDLLLLDLTECATTPDISFNDPTKQGWRPDLLINVAITRTRQKLIIIGNLPYFRSRYPHDSFIRRVLRSASSTGSTLHAIDLKQLMTQ
jgi:superfamily I DNA and/or RNA helicase